eukprot:2578652-Prorocentrum_lima.AAC.1
MRESMPATDLSRMCIARELQTQVSRVPTSRAHFASLLEYYIHKLDYGMKLGALMEPRTIIIGVMDTM